MNFILPTGKGEKKIQVKRMDWAHHNLWFVILNNLRDKLKTRD